MDHHLPPLERLQSELEELLQTVTRFSTIIHQHMNDFIISDVWSNTKDVRHELSKLLDEQKLPNSMPCCYHYELVNTFDAPAPSMTDPTLASDTLTKCHRFCKKRYTESTQVNDSNNKNLNSFLTIKKEHEVLCLSSILNDIADESLCRKIVDFGSGKGYLGQYMTSHHDCDVLGIEMNFGCSSSAESMKEKMKTAHHDVTYDRYKTINHTVQATDGTSNEDTISLVSLIKENFHSNLEKADKYMLTGLHACGDLTVSAIKAFVKENDFKAICIVGCCYNLISEEGLPVSKRGKTYNLEFCKSEKMLACQCPSKWVNTRQTLNKSLLYRAILQKIFKDFNFTDDDINQIKLRRLGRKEISFGKYMETVRKRCPPLDQKLSREKENTYFENYHDIWDQMKEFHWLRMQLGPLLEKIIILDRMAFLLEEGFSDVAAIRIFDQVISPRCFAIVCSR